MIDKAQERLIALGDNFADRSLDDIIILAQKWSTMGLTEMVEAQRELVQRYRPQDLTHYDKVMEMEG